MSPAWQAAFGFSSAAVVVVLGTVLAARLLAVRSKKVRATRDLTYECGEEPDGAAWVRFHPRYYVVALLFVLFDVETAFILPWALNLEGGDGPALLLKMGVFVGVLLLGWGYAVRKGALTWQ
jgi:NADH-quinone oxidoreductase subunit A